MGFSFASTEIIKKKEVFTYPFDSFVSEVGGALGLFLGFSFIMLWDLFKVFVNMYNKLVNLLYLVDDDKMALKSTNKKNDTSSVL